MPKTDWEIVFKSGKKEIFHAPYPEIAIGYAETVEPVKGILFYGILITKQQLNSCCNDIGLAYYNATLHDK